MRGLQHRPGKGLELRAALHQPAQCVGVAGVVLGDHVGGGHARGQPERRLVGLGQLVVRGLVHIERQLQRARPPAGKVVVARDLVERQALIVVRANPGHRVDAALLQRRVGIGDRQVDGLGAPAGQHLAGEAAGLDLQAAQVVQRLDLAAEPAAHLRAGEPAGKIQDAVFVEQHPRQRQSLALEHPGVHLPGVQAERHAGIETQRGIGIEEPRRCGVPAIDDAMLDRVQHLASVHQVAGREDLDAELAVGDVADVARHVLGAGEQGRRLIRKAGSQPPRHGGRFLCVDRRGDRGAARGPQGGSFQKRTALHETGLQWAPASVRLGRAARRLGKGRQQHGPAIQFVQAEFVRIVDGRQIQAIGRKRGRAASAVAP